MNSKWLLSIIDNYSYNLVKQADGNNKTYYTVYTVIILLWESR